MGTKTNGKVCDGASVGVLVMRAGRGVLIGTRADGAGLAPIAGHVFDEHDSYESAAVAEVAEEAGLTIERDALSYVAGGYRGNRCGRGDGPDGPGHNWKVYVVESDDGEPFSADAKMLGLHWADTDELANLAGRTLDWVRGRLNAPAWNEWPGLEPVWCRWLAAAGLLTLTPDEQNEIERTIIGGVRAGSVSSRNYQDAVRAVADAQRAVGVWLDKVRAAAEARVGDTSPEAVTGDGDYLSALPVLDELSMVEKRLASLADVADRTDTQNATTGRCAAAHIDDPTPCDGPPAVTIRDRQGGEAVGCEHHAARLLAALEGGKVYPLPGHDGAAIRVFKAANE